ncbi:MAG: hypothetical protein AAGH38_04680, partial [Pseudomonadota bacterium]
MLRALRWLFYLVGIVVIAAAAWPWKVVLDERIGAQEFQDYLSQTVVPLDYNEPDAGFEFPDWFYDQRIFFLGEIHGTQHAQLLDLALMKHLNQRIGVRWLMAELSPVQAARFNRFLDTGDASVVDPVFSRWLASATQWGNQQHFEKLVAVRDYNMTLPEEQRLRYFGIDRIGDGDVEDAAAWVASELASLPEDGAVDETLVSFKTAAEAYSSDPDGFIVAARAFGDWTPPVASSETENPNAIGTDDTSDADTALAEEVTTPDTDDTDYPDYPDYTDDPDYTELKYIALNVATLADTSNRYPVFLRNIELMVNQLGIGDDEPVYGFWGLFHSLKTKVNVDGRPLALRLEESDFPFSNAIVSTIMVYADSDQNLPSYILPKQLQADGPYTDLPMGQNNPYLLYLDGIGDLITVADDADAALFDLNRDNSPYRGVDRLKRQSGILTRVFPFDIDQSERRASEFIVLVKDS